jgi:hypothetical protein
MSTQTLAPLAINAAAVVDSTVNEQDSDGALEKEITRVAPHITEVRHQTHQHPELSNREFQTAELVAAHLRSLGLEVRTGIALTGVEGC